MVSALQILEPSQVLLIAPGIARRMSMTAYRQGLRGGQRTLNAAINAGIHRSFDYLRYDPANREPVESKDCIGAKVLTIGPLIPLQLLLRAGGTPDLERFMRRLFRYDCDARLATLHLNAMIEAMLAVSDPG